MRPIPALLLCAVMLLQSPIDGQQPRDNRRPTGVGTGSISGIVAAGDEDTQPLRRVQVVITGSELQVARTAITNDAGAFSFEGLPAGRYSLTASKAGYAPMAFGASRSGRPGSVISLARGQVRQVDVKLPRGAVITGMLRDPQGDPAPGVTILPLVQQFAPETGERRLRPVHHANTVTDDRGVYRIFGLAEGTYALTALPRRQPGLTGEILPVSAADVQRALAEVQQHRNAPRPGMPPPSRPGTSEPAPRTGGIYTPTYYPGSALQSRATLLTLSAGEVRTGVDFDLEFVTLARVEGHVTVPAGLQAEVMLLPGEPEPLQPIVRMAVADADGRFTIAPVPPGHYALHGRTLPSRVRTDATALWGHTELIVSGEDVEGVTLSLQPTLTLSGAVTFESREVPAPRPAGLRLPLRITSRTGGSVPLPDAVIDGSRVSVTGVAPGDYRFLSPPQGILRSIGRWWLKSILLDGRETLDEPLTIGTSAQKLEVRLSDRASQLSGVVTDAAGATVTGAFAVVFSDDRRHWFPHSRRIAAVRLNADGAYVIRNLPEGQYWLAVTSDLLTDEWFDPEALEKLRPGAIRIGITGDDRVVQNVSVQ